MNIIDEIRDAVARLPRWARPTLYGALFFLFLMFRGPRFVFWLVVIVLLPFLGDERGEYLRLIAVTVSLTVIGGAIGGLLYTLVGQWIYRIPLVGTFLAGVIIASPSSAAGVVLARLQKGIPVLAPVDGPTCFAFGALALLLGWMARALLVGAHNSEFVSEQGGTLA